MEIPKIIHYIWLGGNPKSEEINRAINTWRKHAPEFKIVEWNEIKLKRLMEDDVFYQNALSNHNYAYASDQARLEILKKYGGVYMDTDMHLLVDPCEYLADRELVLCFQNTSNLNDEVIETSFIACIPNFPLITELLDVYKNMTYDVQNLTPNSELLGPLIFKKYRLDHNKRTQSRLEDKVIIYSSDIFWQPTFKSVAIHVGLKSWGELNSRDKIRIFLRKRINNRLEASIFQLGSNSILLLNKIKRKLKHRGEKN